MEVAVAPPGHEDFSEPDFHSELEVFMMRPALALALASILVVPLTDASAVDVLYVSPDGNGDGSRNSPGNMTDVATWASRAADSNLKVVFLDGIYTDPLRLENLAFEKKVLSLEGAAPEGAVFQSGPHPSGTPYGGTIGLSHCRGLVIRHLHFRMAADSTVHTNHLRISDCSDIVVDECSVSGVRVHTGAIVVSNQSERVTISRCMLENMWGRGPSDSSNHMIYVASGSSCVRIVDCQFTDNFGGGWVKIKQASWDILFSNCRFTNSGRRFIEYEHPSLKGAIQINNNEGRENVCKGIVVLNNKFVSDCDEPMTAVWVRTVQKRVPHGHFQMNEAHGRFVDGTVNFEPMSYEL